MKYARILMAVAGQPWAMEYGKFEAMLDILRFAAEGNRRTVDDIAARLEASVPEAKKLTPAQDRSVAGRQGAVMVLPMHGVISNRAPMVDQVSTGGGTSVEKFTAQFRAAMADTDVKAIIIDVNSPGGSVGGVHELSELIFNSRGEKPIIAHINDMGASAAYWIPTAADEVVASPSAMAGSIGVYTAHDDVSKMLEGMGVDRQLIAAGKYKVEGNPYGPLSEEAREAMQDMVNQYYDMFVDAVARNRGAASKDVRNGYGEGRVLPAKAALKEGMIDRIATMDETLARFGVGPLASNSSAKAGTPRRNLAARRLQLL